MAEEKFRLPGSSYPELTKIIKAYGHVKPDSSVEDVAKLAVMNRTTVSRSTVFLTSVGVIRGGQKKTVTPMGKALAQALEHDIPEEIVRHWRPLVEAHDYFQKLLAAVRIRNGMDSATLTAHAAYTAGHPATSDSKTGATAVIDILRAAGLLLERDGKLHVAEANESRDSFGKSIVNAADERTKAKDVNSHGAIPQSKIGAEPLVSLQIQIHVNCEPDKIADLAPGIQELILAVSKSIGSEPVVATQALNADQ